MHARTTRSGPEIPVDQPSAQQLTPPISTFTVWGCLAELRQTVRAQQATALRRQCLGPKQHPASFGICPFLTQQDCLKTSGLLKAGMCEEQGPEAPTSVWHFPIRFEKAKASPMTANSKEAAWNPERSSCQFKKLLGGVRRSPGVTGSHVLPQHPAQLQCCS